MSSDEKPNTLMKVAGGVLGCLGLGVVGVTLLTCGGTFGVGVAINSNTLDYSVLQAPRKVTVRHGPLAQLEGDDRAATLVMQWVQERSRLSVNGFNILFQHAWYNAITSNYDLQLWIDGPNYNSYALYQSGSTVFFRNEADYHNGNRVLVVDWTVPELEEALKPLMVPKSDPW